MNVFLEFHECGKFIRTLNATFISPIPKKVWVGEIKDICPISLVSSVYKNTVKVFTNRSKIFLESIISKTHYAFIKGRQILDFVLITNECITGCIISGELGMLCKFDLEKAYEYISWDFFVIHVKAMWLWEGIAELDNALHNHCLALYSD